MPNMNGLEALKLIRQQEERRGYIRPRASKLIIATAGGDDHSIRTVFRQLCDAYVVKPVDGAEFLGIVECLCALPEHR